MSDTTAAAWILRFPAPNPTAELMAETGGDGFGRLNHATTFKTKDEAGRYADGCAYRHSMVDGKAARVSAPECRPAVVPLYTAAAIAALAGQADAVRESEKSAWRCMQGLGYRWDETLSAWLYTTQPAAAPVDALRDAYKAGYVTHAPPAVSMLLREAAAALTSPAIAPAGDAFERAMKASWQMVTPNPTWAAGSYYAGQNNGMIAALQTVRENYDREAAALNPAITPAGGCYWIHAADWNRIVLDMPLGDDRGAKGYQEALDDVTRALCALPRPAAPQDGAPLDELDRKRFERAPCYLCGYSGEGYYQPGNHPCAARYHAPQDGEADQPVGDDAELQFSLEQSWMRELNARKEAEQQLAATIAEVVATENIALAAIEARKTAEAERDRAVSALSSIVGWIDEGGNDAIYTIERCARAALAAATGDAGGDHG